MFSASSMPERFSRIESPGTALNSIGRSDDEDRTRVGSAFDENAEVLVAIRFVGGRHAE